MGENRRIDLEIRKRLAEYELQVSLHSESRRIGILGRSGCGKSMTLKAIAGIVTPDAGHIVLDGRALCDTDKRLNLRPQSRQIGYLFQNYALFPRMSVRENVMAGIRGTRGERRARAQELLERCRLQELAERYPAELSGGQQQRVALARLLAAGPQAILLDEPFSALDADRRDQLQRQLAETLRDFPGLMILVSHDRDEIYRFCDTLLVMERGRGIRFGSTREVFADPQVKMAARLTGCKNFTDLVRIDAHHARLTDWGMDLVTEREIPQGTTCLGYRAHEFIPVRGTPGPQNSFPVQVADQMELPFERGYYLRPQGKPGADNPSVITWFVQEGERERIDRQGLPDFLQLAERELLFLF